MSQGYDISFDLSELTDSSFGFQSFDKPYQRAPEIRYESPSKFDADDGMEEAQVDESTFNHRKLLGRAEQLVLEEPGTSTPPLANFKKHTKIYVSPGSKVSFSPLTEVLEFGGNRNRKVSTPLKDAHELPWDPSRQRRPSESKLKIRKKQTAPHLQQIRIEGAKSGSEEVENKNWINADISPKRIFSSNQQQLSEPPQQSVHPRNCRANQVNISLETVKPTEQLKAKVSEVQSRAILSNSGSGQSADALGISTTPQKPDGFRSDDSEVSETDVTPKYLAKSGVKTPSPKARSVDVLCLPRTAPLWEQGQPLQSTSVQSERVLNFTEETNTRRTKDHHISNEKESHASATFSTVGKEMETLKFRLRRNSLGRSLAKAGDPLEKTTRKMIEKPETPILSGNSISSPSKSDKSHSFESVMNLIDANLKSPFDRWAKDVEDSRLKATNEQQGDLAKQSAPGGDIIHPERPESVLSLVEASEKCNSYSDLPVTNNDAPNTSLDPISFGTKSISLENPPESPDIIKLGMDKSTEHCSITLEAPLESCSPSPMFSKLGTTKDFSLAKEPARSTNPNSMPTRKRKRSIVGNNGAQNKKTETCLKKPRKQSRVISKEPRNATESSVERKRKNSKNISKKKVRKEDELNKQIRVKLELDTDVYVNPNFNHSFSCNG